MIFSHVAPWPVLLIVSPLLLALCAFLVPRSTRLCSLGASLGILLLTVLLTLETSRQGALRYPLGGWPPELGIGLVVDGFNLWLLWLAALINSLLGLYASVGRRMTPLWLLLWAALNGILLSADLFNLYVALELMGLSAVALVALAATPAARKAAFNYLLLNIFGSLCFLLGVVFIYRQTGVLHLELFHTLNYSQPLSALALALLTLGLLIKSAIFPLHFWLPPAHSQAPAPVSALLSALVVKAPFYLLLRIWLPILLGERPPSTLLLSSLGVLGAAAILWGSLQALGSRELKELIAYSTVAQMGYLFLLFPLLEGGQRGMAIQGALFFLSTHALAKAALFLSAGTMAEQGKREEGPLLVEELRGLGERVPLASFTLALSAVCLMGLPPSGGFVAKWYLLSVALENDRWGWAAVIIVGGLLGLAYLLRPVARTFSRGHKQTVPECVPLQSKPGAALLLALAAILLGLFPWLPLELPNSGLPSFIPQAGGGAP